MRVFLKFSFLQMLLFSSDNNHFDWLNKYKYIIYSIKWQNGDPKTCKSTHSK